MPFDLLVRNGGESFDDLMTDGRVDGQKLLVALEQSRSTRLVEVKASASRRKDAFEISLAEVVAAWKYPEQYWIFRIENLSQSEYIVTSIENIPDALLSGRGKLHYSITRKKY